MRKVAIILLGSCIAAPIYATTNTQADVTITLSKAMAPCTIKLEKVWTPGHAIDPADNYNTHLPPQAGTAHPQGTIGFPNPDEFFTNSNKYPGVTLPGPDRMKSCQWKVGTNFTWDAQQEQCVLNGPYWSHPTMNNLQCTSGAKFNSQLMPWIDAVVATAGKAEPPIIKMTLTIPGEGSKTVPVALGFGHGVLGTTCGGVSLVEYNGEYAAIMQTGMRAWSFEISTPTSTYLDPHNTSGSDSCMIPKVYQLSDADVKQILGVLENQKAQAKH